MLNRDKLIYLGYIGKAHGIRGNICVKSLMQNPTDIVKMALQDELGSELTLKLEAIKSEFLICSLVGISDRNAAELLRGTKLYTIRSQLPEANDMEYYIEDLKGLRVISASGKHLGQILEVHNFGAGDIIEVTFSNGESEMYPFTHEFFPTITKDGAILAKLSQT